MTLFYLTLFVNKIDEIESIVYNINRRTDMSENKTRYHFVKHYVENPVKFANVHLLQVGRRYCEMTEIIPSHPHLNWFELTVVTGGCGTITTNGEDTVVQAGDVYLSFPCDIHEIKADKGVKLEYDFFSFYCTHKALSKDLKNITQNYRGGDKRIFQDEKISRLLEYAISEFTLEGQQHSQSALCDVFHLIIVYTIRNFSNAPRHASNVSESEILCMQLMNYIDTHIYSIKKLEELAPKFNYNYGYLSSLFKQTTGKTLSEYYQKRKMETGKALVLENKKKVGEIAEMLGYNLYSFSKAFKRAYGTSPKSTQKASGLN